MSKQTDLPHDEGRLLYRWTPPAMPDDVLDSIGTPDEYAVFALGRTPIAEDRARTFRWVDYGGCIIYGWYEHRQEWIANVSARALVLHLLETKGL